jgi:hypothetical protein
MIEQIAGLVDRGVTRMDLGIDRKDYCLPKGLCFGPMWKMTTPSSNEACILSQCDIKARFRGIGSGTTGVTPWGLK